MLNSCVVPALVCTDGRLTGEGDGIYISSK
jgi:hypothetical protein